VTFSFFSVLFFFWVPPGNCDLRRFPKLQQSSLSSSLALCRISFPSSLSRGLSIVRLAVPPHRPTPSSLFYLLSIPIAHPFLPIFYFVELTGIGCHSQEPSAGPISPLQDRTLNLPEAPNEMRAGRFSIPHPLRRTSNISYPTRSRLCSRTGSATIFDVVFPPFSRILFSYTGVT